MNRTNWLAVSALLCAAHVNAQAAPAAAPAAKPAPSMAPAAKPAATPTAAPTTSAKPAATPAAATAPADKSVEFAVDPGHSHIGFTAKHLGFSKVEGNFKKFTATVRADPKTGKITALEAEADTASVDTGIEKRDAHLKSEDFFAADKYPQLKLKLKAIKFTGNKFTAKADLTIRDVTKEIPFKGELLGAHEVNFGQGPQFRAGYEASATISRKEFGLKYSAITEGLSVVGDAVEIQLSAEIAYTAPAAPATAAATPAPAAPAAKPTAPAPVVAPPAAKPKTASAATPPAK